MLIYQEIDWNQYIFAGIALNANIQGLLMTPLLLKSDYKRNLLIVFSNLFYFISNIISFSGRLNENCQVAMYFVQVFIIFGSIFEVHTPLIRAFKLLDGKVKKVVPVLSSALVISIFCSLINLYGSCGSTTSVFIYVHVSIVPDAVASVFSISIYAISFFKIIQMIDSSEFVKENPKMQMIKSIAKYSIFFVIIVRILMIALAIAGYDENEKLTTALRTNLVVFLMVVQIVLELSKHSTDIIEKSDVESGRQSRGQKRPTKEEYNEKIRSERKLFKPFQPLDE